MLMLIWAKGAFFGLIALLGGLALGLSWWQALLLSGVPFLAGVLQFARRPLYTASLVVGALGAVVFLMPETSAGAMARAGEFLAGLRSGR